MAKEYIQLDQIQCLSTLLDCGRVSVNDASDTSISLHWNCPCSNWIGVDKYEFEFMAEDGEIDYTHTSRVEGKRMWNQYQCSIKKNSFLKFRLW